MSLPEIQIPVKLFSIIKIMLLVSTFVVVAINVLSATATSALPENTTDWNFGSGTYPDGYFVNGYPSVCDCNPLDCFCELVDDKLEEQEELEDEQEHSEESEEYDNNSNSKEEKD